MREFLKFILVKMRMIVILMATAAYLASSVSSFDNSPHLNARVTSAALIMDGNDNENDQIKFESILRMEYMEKIRRTWRTWITWKRWKTSSR